MTEIASKVLVATFGASCAVGVLAWGYLVFCLIRLPLHVKPNGLAGWWRFNPFNVVFFADTLTESGLAIRKRLLLALVAFFAAMLTAVIAYALAKISSER